MYKNYHFYRYFPKIRKKKHFKAKKKHKKAHFMHSVRALNIMYTMCGGMGLKWSQDLTCVCRGMHYRTGQGASRLRSDHPFLPKVLLPWKQ